MKTTPRIGSFLKQTTAWTLCALSLASCNPYEKATDALASVANEVLPSNENKDIKVGKVVVTSATGSVTGTQKMSVIVLNQEGNRIAKTVKVTCTFTNASTGTQITLVESSTTSGAADCEVLNTTGSTITVDMVATSEGVSSDKTTFSLKASS